MKILVVEDDIKIANSIKKGLEQEKYTVDVAYDGEYGFDLAYSEHYDLIILDLMLPKLSGEEFCENLREENIDTPIIMLTAKAQIDDKIMGLNIGADDYLTKPFDFDELLARIKAVLRRPKKVEPEYNICGAIKINNITKTVEIDNTLVDFSKKEYELLEYLVKNKNAFKSKEQIINEVWSYESNILPNTVEVYIGYLRQKLGKYSIYIKTKRGFGYKIESENV